MPEIQFVPYPTSKITQFKVAPFCTSHILCEDGSLWEFHNGKGFCLLAAPPNQPTPPDDLEEALDVIESMMTNPDNDFQPTFGWDILKKHGRVE